MLSRSDDTTNNKNNKNYFSTAFTFAMPRRAKTKTKAQATKEKKGVAWYIPPRLRHWLNSHAEYLSAIGPEMSTDAMVVQWLKERVRTEEKKRDASKLERAVEGNSE